MNWYLRDKSTNYIDAILREAAAGHVPIAGSTNSRNDMYGRVSPCSATVTLPSPAASFSRTTKPFGIRSAVQDEEILLADCKFTKLDTAETSSNARVGDEEITGIIKKNTGWRADINVRLSSGKSTSNVGGRPFSKLDRHADISTRCSQHIRTIWQPFERLMLRVASRNASEPTEAQIETSINNSSDRAGPRIACTSGTPIKKDSRTGRHHFAPCAAGEICLDDGMESGKLTAVDDGKTSCHRCRGMYTESILNGIKEMLTRYAEALEARPLLVKCITSGVIGAVGDVVSQGILLARGNGPIWQDRHAVWRTMAVALDGGGINAPCLHFIYDALERWMPAEDGLFQATGQVAFDLFILDPAYAFVFIITTGFFQGMSFRGEVWPIVESSYVTLVFWLVVCGLALAPPRVFLFGRFPVKWRVLISDLTDLLWTVLACFIIPM